MQSVYQSPPQRQVSGTRPRTTGRTLAEIAASQEEATDTTVFTDGPLGKRQRV